MEHVEVMFGGKSFYKVLGTSPVAGTGGPLYTYTVYIQKGLGLPRLKTAERIDKTLADPRGWTRTGRVRFQRVEAGAGTDCFLAAPDQVDYLCQPLDTAGEVSCCIGRNVVLNVKRWREAVPHWEGSLLSYRQMVISHEFGHRAEQHHRYCVDSPVPGVCPVMQQMTYGLQGCRENSWPLDAEVASL